MMPRVVTLGTQHFAVCGVKAYFRMLGEGLHVMDVETDARSTAFTHETILDTALLALVAMQRKSVEPPLFVRPTSTKPHVFFMHAASPMRVFVSSQPASINLAQVGPMFSGELTARLLAMPAVLVVPQRDTVFLEALPYNRFAHVVHAGDLFHGVLLVKLFKHIALWLKGSFPSGASRLYPIS